MNNIYYSYYFFNPAATPHLWSHHNRQLSRPDARWHSPHYPWPSFHWRFCLPCGWQRCRLCPGRKAVRQVRASLSSLPQRQKEPDGEYKVIDSFPNRETCPSYILVYNIPYSQKNVQHLHTKVLISYCLFLGSPNNLHFSGHKGRIPRKDTVLHFVLRGIDNKQLRQM